MPKWSQAPIKNYLETGNFNDHKKLPLSEADAKEGAKDIRNQMDEFIAADNTAEDLNKAPGVVDLFNPLLGNIHGEFVASADGKTKESFMQIGTPDIGAVIYSRVGEDSLDTVVVSHGVQGAEDGAVHISVNDPNGSFTTFDLSQMQQFIVA